MLRVGLTGGIGSGKTEVGRRLVRHGAVLIDSDVLAREVVAPGTEGLAAVVEAFGPGVLADDGSLDRPALGRTVFGDDAARHRLESIVHPRVRERAAALEATLDDGAVVVHDIPLLVETGQAGDFDVVVVVDAPDAVRIQRLVRDRDMTDDEARGRIAAQAGRDERLAAADHVVVNDAGPDDLDLAVEALWRRLRGEQAG